MTGRQAGGADVSTAVSSLVDLDSVFSHCVITSLILESVSESVSSQVSCQSETLPASFIISYAG